MRKLSHEELIARQAEILQKNESTVCIRAVLNNIRSLYNVGSMFRSADGAGLEKLYLCGITGIPPHPKLSKTALGAEKTVPWKYFEKAELALSEAKADGFQIILLEQIAQSIPYQQFVPKGKICFVVGNEISGIAESLLPFCDQALEIEMAGLKNSLNVTVAFGILAYHFRNNLISRQDL